MLFLDNNNNNNNIIKPGMLSIVVIIIIYGIALPITASAPLDRTKQIVSCVVIWVFSVLLIFLVYRRIAEIFYVKSTKKNAYYLVWETLDIIVSMYHLLAALGLSIWLMDGSPGKDYYFLGIPNTDYVYSVFVGDFLLMTISVLNTAGFVSVRPRPSTPLSAIWSILVSLNGILLIVFLLGVTKRNIDIIRVNTSENGHLRAPIFVSKYTTRPKVYHKKF